MDVVALFWPVLLFYYCSIICSMHLMNGQGALAFSAQPMTSTMIIQDGIIYMYHEEGQAEVVELFASSTAYMYIICLSKCRASLQQHKGDIAPQTSHIL